MSHTIRAMRRIEEIRMQRERDFYASRMKGAQRQQAEEKLHVIAKHADLIPQREARIRAKARAIERLESLRMKRKEQIRAARMSGENNSGGQSDISSSSSIAGSGFAFSSSTLTPLSGAASSSFVVESISSSTGMEVDGNDSFQPPVDSEESVTPRRRSKRISKMT